MSTKLVKRLLQQQDRVDDESEKPARKRKRHKRQQDDDSPVVDTAMLIQHQISGIVSMDRSFQSSKSRSTNVLRNVRTDTKQPRQSRQQLSKKESKAPRAVAIGNSRSSASSFQQQKSQPTFNKVKHKKQKEAERTKKLAALLEKTRKKAGMVGKKKKKKPTTTKTKKNT